MPIDERDELTRLQNELTSSPSDDPRRSSLQARISDLLRIHGASRAGPRATTSWKRIWDDVDQTTLIQQFGPVFGDGDKWEFRSGRLANCSISMSDFLTCGEAIRSRTNLHELTLHGIGGDGLVDMRRARFDKLRRLNAPDVILKKRSPGASESPAMLSISEGPRLQTSARDTKVAIRTVGTFRRRA